MVRVSRRRRRRNKKRLVLFFRRSSWRVALSLYAEVCMYVYMWVEVIWSGQDLPTAVNFERTWMIMTVVMARARICMKSVAASKMMVFASSMLRA